MLGIPFVTYWNICLKSQYVVGCPVGKGRSLKRCIKVRWIQENTFKNIKNIQFPTSDLTHFLLAIFFYIFRSLKLFGIFNISLYLFSFLELIRTFGTFLHYWHFFYPPFVTYFPMPFKLVLRSYKYNFNIKLSENNSFIKKCQK